MPICYKDMTFCNAPCANKGCPRNYTEEVHEAAKRWWSHDPDNAPVALSDLSQGCPDFIEPSNWNSNTTFVPPEAEGDFGSVTEAQVRSWQKELNERFGIGSGKLVSLEEPEGGK